MVIVGSARIDENGNIGGGKAGDQTGREVCTENWYLHKQGWRVFRCKDSAKAEKIAQDMQFACDNPHIGYDQWNNTSLYNEAKKYGFDCSKVTVDVECDCSRLVRVCCLYAGINVKEFYTYDEPQALMATGLFEELTDAKYTTIADYLKRGDILVTKGQGHTVVVMTNGDKAVPKEEPKKEEISVMYAESYDLSLRGKYTVSGMGDMNMRRGAGTGYKVITVVPNNAQVVCYGYYTMFKQTKWLYVTYNGKVGFISSKGLKKTGNV